MQLLFSWLQVQSALKLSTHRKHEHTQMGDADVDGHADCPAKMLLLAVPTHETCVAQAQPPTSLPALGLSG